MTGLAEEKPATHLVAGSAAWKVRCHEEVPSTSDLARGLPAWSAVVAEKQTGGRGRHGRAFASGPGGLWLTAVVPAEGGGAKWSGFSLAAGLHLLDLLARLRVPGIRLRWPNDLMANNRKVAGILIEESGSETLLVGLGLNVWNRPWEEDPSLESTAARIADLIPRSPRPEELLAPALDAIADAHEAYTQHGFAPVAAALNELWTPRKVRLALHGGGILHGTFLGIESQGDLRIAHPDGSTETVPHHHVLQLVET